MYFTKIIYKSIIATIIRILIMKTPKKLISKIVYFKYLFYMFQNIIYFTIIIN